MSQRVGKSMTTASQSPWGYKKMPELARDQDYQFKKRLWGAYFMPGEVFSKTELI